MNNNEITMNENTNAIVERDRLVETKRVFDYLDEHPEVGVITGSFFAAGGITSMIVYGCKMIAR